MAKPVIGITLDAEEGGGYSQRPWYALRKEYGQAITSSGGVPFHLPHEIDSVDDFIRHIDGLLLTGGDFDIDPALYGAAEKHEEVILKNRRTQFEVALTRKALEKNIPILGVCAGEQLLNVLFGGTLIQHIPDEVPNALPHNQREIGIPQHKVSHDITIKEGTKLYAITGMEQMQVNSTHHQAVKEPAPALNVNAIAPDGVIEGIEHNSHPFCIGVEWHPEYFNSEGDVKLFEAFIKACGS